MVTHKTDSHASSQGKWHYISHERSRFSLRGSVTKIQHSTRENQDTGTSFVDLHPLRLRRGSKAEKRSIISNESSITNPNHKDTSFYRPSAILYLNITMLLVADGITKYRDLEIELQKYWNLNKINTIPTVIVEPGTTCRSLANLTGVSEDAKIRVVQKTTLFVTVHI